MSLAPEVPLQYSYYVALDEPERMPGDAKLVAQRASALQNEAFPHAEPSS